ELRARDGRRTKIREGTLVKGKVCCPRCKHVRRLGEANAERPPRWRLFAQEVLVPDVADRSGFRRVFKPATEADRARYDAAEAALAAFEAERGALRPTRPIPEAPRFDRRPLLHGVTRYDQLFNAR